MKLAIRRVREDDERFGIKKGDMLLVDLDYDWDPGKVSVMAVLPRGCDPGCSQYKKMLAKPTDEEIVDYITGKK